jgi:hypothetical protein
MADEAVHEGDANVAFGVLDLCRLCALPVLV